MITNQEQTQCWLENHQTTEMYKQWHFIPRVAYIIFLDTDILTMANNKITISMILLLNTDNNKLGNKKERRTKGTKWRKVITDSEKLRFRN